MPKPRSEEKKLEWAEKFRKQKESGLSIEKWCRENKINMGKECGFATFHTDSIWKVRPHLYTGSTSSASLGDYTPDS